MRKPGFLLLIIGLLLVAAGCLIYLAANTPKVSNKARLVEQRIIELEKGGIAKYVRS